jgi:hypothetical protein
VNYIITGAETTIGSHAQHAQTAREVAQSPRGAHAMPSNTGLDWQDPHAAYEETL